MSDTHIIMKLEFLPNEILFECFQYLNAVHIFHSFDQLNYRFNKLIRSIPLHLDFQNIHKLLFDQFCTKILSNPEIKAQVYSLHLSNDKTCNNIQSWLSFFSLDELCHLRSLTLTLVKPNDVSQLTSVLPLLPHLCCCRLISCYHTRNEIFSVLPVSQLRTLHIGHIISDLELTCDLSSIIYLTIYGYDFDQLCRVLKNATRLKYLKVKNRCGIHYDTLSKINYSVNHHTTSVKRLILMEFHGRFSFLIEILKQTPNLNSLTILTLSRDKDMMDACKWEDLITSSLPFLKILKFHLKYFWEDENEGISHERLKRYQSDFWQKQHHWYTEYSLSNREASIYTIPYIIDTYVLPSNTNRYFDESVNNVNTFDHVRNLTLTPDLITEKCQYHFSYVTSLTLRSSPDIDANQWLDIKYIGYLKMIVKLSNIKHLVVSNSLKLETPFVLLKILTESPHLSSLTIGWDVLMSLFDNDELCRYLNKMIKKLDISFDLRKLFENSYKMKQFCEVFSNIEELRCRIIHQSSLLFLIQHLSKLSYINNTYLRWTSRDEIPWLDEEEQKLGVKIIIDVYAINPQEVSIWIIRDIHQS